MIPLNMVASRKKAGATITGDTWGLWDDGPYTQPSDVIFETNFSADTGYASEGDPNWNRGLGLIQGPPSGWDAIKSSTASRFDVISNEGVGGNTNAMRVSWDPSSGQPTASLAKHLSGSYATGYDELFIRYHVRMPDNFMAGDYGSTLNYWKWGRLWQNTTPDDQEPGPWHENRVNSQYAVWNFSGNIPYTRASAVFPEPTGSNLQYGSSGGASHGVDYFITGSDQHDAPGYFESLWDIDTVTNPGKLLGQQAWHTVEYRFKLATSVDAENGIFEMYWDGVPQGKFTRLLPNYTAPQRAGIPTTRNSSGYNFFTFFDNMSGWNTRWGDAGIDGFIYVNDLVVSRKRIGHTYIAGNTDNTGAGAT